MKRTRLNILALAGGIIAMPLTAVAQTSVTLYGVVDAGVGYERVKGPNGFSQSRVGSVDGVNSGSRWGLRGQEDLGDGLRAIFNVESGFSANTGMSGQSNRLFGRRATVGLASDDWGTLEFGRRINLASDWIGNIVDPFGTSFRTANLGSAFSAANTMRVDNLVLYQTPTFGGWQAGLGYSFNVDSTRADNAPGTTDFATGNNNRLLTAGLRYSNGPVYAALSYDRLNPTNGAVGGQSPARIQQYMIAGSYDFEILKVHAIFGQTYDGWFQGQTMGVTPNEGGFENMGTYKLRDGFRANSYLLGATLPLGASKVFASWQRADPNNASLTGDDSTMNVYSVGYTYDLSKRTNLYAYVSYGDNYAFNRDASNQAAAVGLRHRF